ncbi:MAG: hypothetical protein MHM6MM_002565 [Cercozoa sp. M6MM]
MSGQQIWDVDEAPAQRTRRQIARQVLEGGHGGTARDATAFLDSNKSALMHKKFDNDFGDLLS